MHLTLVQCLRRGVRNPRIVHSGLGKYTTDYDNLPERYMIKKTTQVEWKSPNNPRYTPRMRSKSATYHDLTRPWQWDYWMKNKGKKMPVVEPIREEDWMWFRGDLVELVKGPDKGKLGIIKMIVQERNWVTVEGLNLKYETIAASDDFPGMSSASEMPLLVTTDIKLVDPSTEQGTDVEWRYTEDGDRVRVALSSGTEIPIPSASYETIDYKSPDDYAEDSEKDTPAKYVEMVTYEPNHGTFEMDIMRIMGIKEDRVAKKTYWY